MVSKQPTAAHRHVPIRVADGRLELGERHTEFPPQLVPLETARPCVICKQPAMWRRPTSVKGAATHPECETGFFDEVSPDLLADAEWSLVEHLGVTESVGGWYQPPATARADRRLGNPGAGCEVCGRGYAALWLVSKTWRCAAHDVLRVPAPKRHWHQ